MTTAAEQLFAALVELRDATTTERTTRLGPWRTISDYLDRRFGVSDREHDDARQRALINIHRALPDLKASHPAQAEGWVSRIYRNARTDRQRFRTRDVLERTARARGADDDDGLARLPSAARSDARQVDDERALEALVAAVMDEVDGWLRLHVHSPSKRLGDRRRAEATLLAHVHGHDADAIAARFGPGAPPSRALIYKWIQRGRDEVLLPAIAAWIERGAAPFDVEVVGTLQRILLDTQRPGGLREHRSSDPVSSSTRDSSERDQEGTP